MRESRDFPPHSAPQRRPEEGERGSGRAIAAIILGVLSLATPLFFLIVTAMQSANPDSFIGYLTFAAIPLSPVSAVLGIVGLCLAATAIRSGARAGLGLTLCVIGTIASLATLAYFQPWSW